METGDAQNKGRHRRFEAGLRQTQPWMKSFIVLGTVGAGTSLAHNRAAKPTRTLISPLADAQPAARADRISGLLRRNRTGHASLRNLRPHESQRWTALQRPRAQKPAPAPHFLDEHIESPGEKDHQDGRTGVRCSGLRA